MRFNEQAQAFFSTNAALEDAPVSRRARHALPHEAIGFVCTGNICRSTYAQFALLHEMSTQHRAHVPEVVSAGVAAVVGADIEQQMAAEFKNRYGSTPKHVAHQISEIFVEGTTLILVMTQQHRREVVRRYPQAAAKLFLLTEFVKILDVAPDVLQTGPGRLLSLVRHAHAHRYLAGAENLDIDDPYRRSADTHHRVAQQLTDVVRHLSRQL